MMGIIDPDVVKKGRLDLVKQSETGECHIGECRHVSALNDSIHNVVFNDLK